MLRHDSPHIQRTGIRLHDGLGASEDPIRRLDRVDALGKRVRVLEHPPESLSPSVAHPGGRSASKVAAETGIEQSAVILRDWQSAAGKVVFMEMRQFAQLVCGIFLGVRTEMTLKHVRRECASVHAYGRFIERRSMDWRI
jgi:hypothetical protein